MWPGLEGKKLFHANALFSRLSLRGRTNEAYVDIEVGLGNPTDLIDGAADQTPRGRAQTSYW